MSSVNTSPVYPPFKPKRSLQKCNQQRLYIEIHSLTDSDTDSTASASPITPSSEQQAPALSPLHHIPDSPTSINIKSHPPSPIVYSSEPADDDEDNIPIFCPPLVLPITDDPIPSTVEVQVTETIAKPLNLRRIWTNVNTAACIPDTQQYYESDAEYTEHDPPSSPVAKRARVSSPFILHWSQSPNLTEFVESPDPDATQLV